MEIKYNHQIEKVEQTGDPSAIWGINNVKLFI